MNLHNLGIKHGTDKASHKYNEMSYLDIYERYLDGIKNEVEVVVEFGVLNGSSLRMWEEYFPNAIIYGIDINPDCKKYETERIKILIGDQNNDEFLNSLNLFFKKIDVIIDDGSHITKHQIKTFESLLKIITSPNFPDKDKLPIIKERFLEYMERTGLPVPPEINYLPSN